MPNNMVNSGSDLIPVVYNVTGTSTTYFWDTPQRLRNPEYFSKPVVTPSFYPTWVTGPSQVQHAQEASGTVACQITQANLSSVNTPYYVDLIVSSVWWKVQGGKPVILPQVIVDVANGSSTYHVALI